jgi:penicillin-binding protein 1B
LALVVLIAGGVTIFYYNKYARLIEEKLSIGPFARTSKLYAAPELVRQGDAMTAEDVAAHLRQAGYSETQGSLVGWYNLRGGAIEIFPGPDSYFRQDPFLIRFADGKVSQILSLRDSTKRNQYQLEPLLLTNLFDRQRQKRRIVRYQDLPPVLVNAVVSVEDKRFFRHAGFDPLRILKAAYVDIRKGYHAEGASTLSMQLARGLWLTPEKTWRRKAAETLITLHLERTLTKEQIFEYYANNVDLGRRGSFQVLGFGEAAKAYFNRDVKKLTLPEAATLAGLIQRPSYTNPVRWPERARARRNIVLNLMRDNGYISEREAEMAAAEPVMVAPGTVDSNDAPYFVDLVNDWLQDELQEHDFQTSSYRVYTTIDPRLQRDATEAVRIGIKEADELIDKRRKRLKQSDGPEPQVALVALDAETGEIRALVGGRNYGVSQLNRARAKWQPGSIFKPFVFAAALSTAIDPASTGEVLTPVTMIEDEPTSFEFDGKEYQPSNFGDKFYGQVTLRTALAKSLNIPTVKIAEMVGYSTVAEVARKAGLTNQVGTPAVALGSYDATPIEMAGAYTVFTNRGEYVKPVSVRSIYDREGRPIFEAKPVRREVLDPRIAYLMVNMMEEVIRSGTGAGVRSRGFKLPAAGKTGTSRDGWFAGFTSKLICVVWVGFDDNTDLKLEGSKSALPIWTEFMKRAHQHRDYLGTKNFAPPEGVTVVDGCSGRPEAFLAGSEPVDLCGGQTQVASWEDDAAGGAVTPGSTPADRRVARAETSIPIAPERRDPEEPAKQKKGFWGRFRDIFK